MLLTVICALMGAYVGLSGRSRVTAVLIAAGLATAAYYVLLYGTAFLVTFAPDPPTARRMLQGWGAPGPALSTVVQAAAFSAFVSGVLLAIVSPNEGRDTVAAQRI